MASKASTIGKVGGTAPASPGWPDGGSEGADPLGGDGQGRRRGELAPHQGGVDGHVTTLAGRESRTERTA